MLDSAINNNEHSVKCSLRQLKFTPCDQSACEIRSPTLNSSFFKKSVLSPSFNQINNSLLISPLPIQRDREQPVGSLFGKICKLLSSPSNRNNEQRKDPQKITNRLVEYFISKLKRKAYIYQVLNSIQKTILTEQYLEPLAEQNESHSIQIYLFIIFEALSTLYVFILLFWIPIEMGFQLQKCSALQGVTIFVMVIDLLKSFYTTHKIDIQQYFETLIDFVSLVAYLVIQFQRNKSLLLIGILLWLALSLNRLKNRLNKWQSLVSFDIGFFYWFFVIIVFIHYCACIWHFIGISNAHSWLNYLGIEEYDNYTKYCYSLYWSTATLFGVGQTSINAITEGELVYSSLIMFISCYLNSYIFVQTFHISKAHYKEQQTKRHLINTAQEFFKNRNISYKLKCQVRRQLWQETNQKNDNQHQCEKMLQKLSPKLKNEVFLTMRKSLLLKCKSLNKFSNMTIERLTQCMELLEFDSSQKFISDCSIFIIESGVIEVLQLNKVVAHLKAGDSFGEYSFFSENQNKTTYKSLGESKVYQIQKAEFLKVIQQQQSDYERYLFMKHSLQQEIYTTLNLFCYSCYSQCHLIEECPSINYKPSINKFIMAMRSSIQKRERYARRVKGGKNNSAIENIHRNQNALKLFRSKNDIPSQDESLAQESFDEDITELDQKEETEVPILVKNIQQQQPKSRVSLLPINQQKSSMSKIKRFSLQDLTGEQLSPQRQQHKQVTFKIQFDTQRIVDDNGTLNYYDDQISSPYTKQSYPNTHQNQSFAKIFPSNISLIPHQVQNFQSMPIIIESNNFQSPGFLDLSVYNQSKNLEFDRLNQYTIYFPHQNSEVIIRIINKYLKRKQREQQLYNDNII